MKRSIIQVALIIVSVAATAYIATHITLLPDSDHVDDVGLASIRGTSPSSTQKDQRNCAGLNASAYNDVNSPPPPPGFAVDDGVCTVKDDNGNFQYNNYVCISCPTAGFSITINDAIVNNGYVKVTDADCGSGVFPFSSGGKGTCNGGACTNTVPYNCTVKISYYQLQSGRGG